MNEPIPNVLGLQNPDSYFCNLERFFIGHSILCVEVMGDERFYVIFQALEYFQGPKAWKGLNLVQEPASACKALVSTVHTSLSDWTPEQIDCSFKLYSIATPTMPIKILSYQVFRSETPYPDFTPDE